jgi:hypothetical protein
VRFAQRGRSQSRPSSVGTNTGLSADFGPATTMARQNCEPEQPSFTIDTEHGSISIMGITMIDAFTLFTNVTFLVS